MNCYFVNGISQMAEIRRPTLLGGHKNHLFAQDRNYAMKTQTLIANAQEQRLV
jgi:hypothetical protein